MLDLFFFFWVGGCGVGFEHKKNANLKGKKKKY